jgi:hypothetical protein
MEINTAPSNVSLLLEENPLPTAVVLNPSFDNQQSRAYFEALEGMLMRLPMAGVVGPTGSRSDTWVIRNDLGLARVFQDDPLGTGEVVCVGMDGHYEIYPVAKVGDQVQSLSGCWILQWGPTVWH